MPVYIVTYEINNADRRNSFTKALQTFNAYCPIHINAWAIMTDLSAKEVRDKLTPYTIQTDRLFVIRSGVEAAWKNSYGQLNDDWLKKNL